MPINAFDGLTPPSTDDPTNFDTRADVWMAAFQTFQTQANALEADLNNLVAAAYTTSSSTSLTIGTGSKSFTVQTGLGFIAGQSGVMSSAADPTNRMIFTVTSYNSTTGAMVVNVSTIGGSGTHADWVVGLAPTGFQAGQTPGTTTNDSAAAGNVGEEISSLIAQASAISLTSLTVANVTYVDLTPGHWEMTGNVFVDAAGGSVTFLRANWSLSSAVAEVQPGFGSNFVNPGLSGTSTGSVVLTPDSVKLSANTRVYLVTNTIFTGTLKAYGKIRAIRVR